MALVYCVAQIADAQNASLTSREIEQRIQHVTSGLIGGVVIKGDEHSTHTLADNTCGQDRVGARVWRQQRRWIAGDS
jgi:hypothetical protein